LLIAVGIGLHNFGEGLAIGAARHAVRSRLATLLVVGFALHNATEGFGIVCTDGRRSRTPGMATAARVGLIGGGPTVLGRCSGTSSAAMR